ncbi:MAG: hypothetical protein HYZ75_03280 [Elusimicrobia bacterium]|nr:hypothetical protein [Elusimicrobiota bacterium]
MSDDGAVLKGSGSFRVDRERALEKLALFAMERGEYFLQALGRVAVASGAKTLHVMRHKGLEVRFDGEPFGAEELKDPYAALFAERTKPRNRHLAVGLLTCLRTRPTLISLESGEGGARRRLELRSLSAETVGPATTPGGDTILRVKWPFWKSWSNGSAAIKAAEPVMALVPPGFFIEGRAALPPFPQGPERREFAADGRRGRVTLPENPTAGSVVTFCVDGVAVQTVETWLPWAQVRAWVDDPGLSLNASQSAVVEDERRRAALDAVAAAGRDLLVGAAQLLSMQRPDGSVVGKDWGLFAPLLPWLREACLSLLKFPDTTGEALTSELRKTPILLDVCYGALSLGALEAARAADGHVAFSRSPCPGVHPPQRVAWAPDQETKDVLNRRFGADLKDVTPLIESLARLP